MITPIELNEFVSLAIANVAELNSGFIVFEESEISARTSSLSKDKLPFLVAILPSAFRGSDSDYASWSDYLMFLVLDKFIQGNKSDLERLEQMNQVHAATEAFVQFLDNQKDNNCGVLGKWGGKVIVDPEYNIADSNGYSILIKTEP